jgi:hypothetical protein
LPREHVSWGCHEYYTCSHNRGHEASTTRSSPKSTTPTVENRAGGAWLRACGACAGRLDNISDAALSHQPASTLNPKHQQGREVFALLTPGQSIPRWPRHQRYVLVMVRGHPPGPDARWWRDHVPDARWWRDHVHLLWTPHAHWHAPGRGMCVVEHWRSHLHRLRILLCRPWGGRGSAWSLRLGRK